MKKIDFTKTKKEDIKGKTIMYCHLCKSFWMFDNPQSSSPRCKITSCDFWIDVWVEINEEEKDKLNEVISFFDKENKNFLDKKNKMLEFNKKTGNKTSYTAITKNIKTILKNERISARMYYYYLDLLPSII